MAQCRRLGTFVLRHGNTHTDQPHDRVLVSSEERTVAQDSFLPKENYSLPSRQCCVPQEYKVCVVCVCV